MPGEDTLYNKKIEIKTLKKKLKREKKEIKTNLKQDTEDYL